MTDGICTFRVKKLETIVLNTYSDVDDGFSKNLNTNTNTGLSVRLVNNRYTTDGYPGSNGVVLQTSINKNSNYQSQLLIPDNTGDRIKLRCQYGHDKWENTQWDEIPFTKEVISDISAESRGTVTITKADNTKQTVQVGGTKYVYLSINGKTVGEIKETILKELKAVAESRYYQEVVFDSWGPIDVFVQNITNNSYVLPNTGSYWWLKATNIALNGTYAHFTANTYSSKEWHFSLSNGVFYTAFCEEEEITKLKDTIKKLEQRIFMLESK